MSVSHPSPGSLILLLVLLCLGSCDAEEPSTNTPSASLADTVKSLLTESSKDLAEGDYESAIRDASTAIQLDPHNASAYELRGAVYIEEKLWDRAERDYLSASRISNDPVYKYKLGEIKFMTRSYEDARSRFAALEGDEHLGDLATYKVFLCDMLGFHDAAALQDLATMDQGSHTAAYYYSHAAWGLYHGDRAEAAKYFSAADQLYGQSSGTPYIASLIESRRFLLAEASFATKDGTSYPNASVFLESEGLRVSTPKGWITLALDQLPDDLSGFPEDLREQIDRMRAIAPDGPMPVSLVTFMTRSGKAYDHVRWAVESAGLSVLTTNGWIVVPFAELPEDQSSFPVDLQQALARRPASPSPKADRTAVASFTTIQGRTYSKAKVQLTNDGLNVLTPQGWITLSFDDLPENLADFPAGWRQQIILGRRVSTPDPSGMAVVSFSTVDGVTYTQAKALLSGEGLRVLTSTGWVTVPFRYLPASLPGFPAGWLPQIEAGRTSPAKGPTGMEVVSFTTRLGKHYDQVRAVMGRNGVRLITSQGWVEVPFQDLPRDVSLFPEDWRETITQRQGELAKDRSTSP